MATHRPSQMSVVFAAVLSCVGFAQYAFAQDSSFTYQGLLTENGIPAHGSHDFEFRLFDAPSLGSQLSFTPFTLEGVSVTSGRFIVTLDFGSSVFDGSDRWLEIAVRPAGSTVSFTKLLPRQQLTAIPYALLAHSATGLPAGTVTRTMLADNAVTSAQVADGGITGLDLDPQIGLWSASGSQVVHVDKFVGIGVSDPLVQLHVRNEALLLGPSALENDEIVVEAQDATIGLYSRNQGVYGSAVALKELQPDGSIKDTWGIVRRTSASASDLLLTYGPSDNYANNPSQMMIRSNGFVGIGTVSPSEKLEVAGTARAAAFVGDGSGLTNLPLPPIPDGHSLQAADGLPDDVVFVNNAGNVGVGTTSPETKLDLVGTFRTSGEIQRTPTGSANLVPIAYGMVRASGELRANSGNVSVNRVAPGAYEITISGESYFWENYVTVVTASATGVVATSGSVNGRLKINTNGVFGLTDAPFHFVVYKP